MANQILIRHERHKEINRITETERELREANDAIQRIDTGSFGRCEGCGQKISGKRLEAIPFARRCIECARQAQQVKTASPGNL